MAEASAAAHGRRVLFPGPLQRGMARVRGGRRTTLWVAGGGVVGTAIYAIVLALLMVRSTYDVWGAMVVAPCLALISWPMFTALLRREEDAWIRRLVVIAFALKVVGALARWGTAFILYEGDADAARYDKVGATIATQFHAGHFAVDLGAPLVGTGFLVLLTGIIYTLVGPTLVGGYLVFAWLGFWGLYCFYRAFRVAMPSANHRRYAVLVFFLPSLVFWPSGIGKEAWLCLSLGLATLGAAHLITGTRGATLPLALGMLGSAMVRPHMAALVFVATVAGFLFRRDAHRTPLTPITRTFTLILLAVVGVLIGRQAASFFNVGDVSVQSVDTVLSDTQNRVVGGGSAFQPHPVHSPADMPGAMLTVLYRPFPWEAGNIQTIATAAEGSLLLLFTVVSLGRVRNLWRYRPGRPYAVLCLAYVLLFVFAFSTFNNFGLLARERVLVYPYLLSLLCLPTMRELRRLHPDLPLPRSSWKVVPR